MNARLFTPTMGPSGWRSRLADPSRHWRKGQSAYELAVAWEAAGGSRRRDAGMTPERLRPAAGERT